MALSLFGSKKSAEKRRTTREPSAAEPARRLYRHGDVLVMAVDGLPAQSTPIPGTVLVYGEATGHSHRIAERDAARLYRGGAHTYLKIDADQATLVHEEHASIVLERGVYRYWRQREYTPERIRPVID